MPKVIIDGKEFTFEPGERLLQFCLDRGMEIPHFCYHPALSIPANCRQCLVRVGMPEVDRATGEPRLDEEGNPVIRWFPKLQPSCSTVLSDGMVVETQRTSDLVRKAHEDNLEIMLINHPLDCPICDQAGECPLQIQTFKYGPEGSRFEFHKVHKPKHIRLGPNVVLDAERCINCTRCVRFTDEISKSHQLTIVSRGDKNYPLTAPGEVFDDPYSMNVIDLCPVGALTDAHFRFKARVWEMSKTPSITVDCSKGTNCFYWVRDNLIMRITPRQNMQVNEYWMPDSARLDFKKFNEDRPDGPEVRHPDGSVQQVDWEQIYAHVADLLRSVSGEEIFFLGSAYATVEDNYLLRELARRLRAPLPQYIPHVEPGSGDGWLVTDDKTPNAQGCERLGIRPVDREVLRDSVLSGKIRVLYVMEDDPVASGLFTADELRGVKVILHYYNTTNQTLPVADLALPAAMVVETIGTYVNEDGIAQRVRPAKAIRGWNRTLMMEMGKSRIDWHGTPFDRWYNEEHMVNCRPGWVVLPAIATRMGLPMNYPGGPRQVMHEIVEREPAFHGATYEAMGLYGYKLQDIGQPV